MTNLVRELGGENSGYAFTLLAARGALDGVDFHGIPVEEARLPARPGLLKLASRVLFVAPAVGPEGRVNG